MIDVEVHGGFLEVVVTDGDAFLLTSSRDPWKLTVPVDHVSRAVPGSGAVSAARSTSWISAAAARLRQARGADDRHLP